MARGRVTAFLGTGVGLFVVLGYANRAAVEANLPACDEHQVGVFRRCSGGGNRLSKGPGCLNYSLILRIPESGPLQNITGANQYILQRQKTALEPSPARAGGNPGSHRPRHRQSGNSPATPSAANAVSSFFTAQFLLHF